MKILHLDNAIDTHLKPVKDSDGVSSALELSENVIRIKNLDIAGTMARNVDFGDNDILNVDLLDTDKFAINSGSVMDTIFDEDNMSHDSDSALCTQQSIKAYVDAVPLGCFSKTLIKLMPIDFISNDDRASAYAVVEDDTSDILGIRAGHSSVELYAFVKIPNGYKATHVQVLASASTSNAVICKTFNLTTGATTDLETFDFNTNQDITDVTATTTADLVIKLLPASNATVIYGARVTIGSV